MKTPRIALVTLAFLAAAVASIASRGGPPDGGRGERGTPAGAEPAGRIFGSVVGPDGEPMERASVHAAMTPPSPGPKAGSAGLAHIALRAANALAAAGRHRAPHPIAPDVLVGRGELRPHLAPITLQFFGDELAEAGLRSLPHFGASDADDDRVVGCDHDPGIDLARTGRSSDGAIST